jgi:membrane protein
MPDEAVVLVRKSLERSAEERSRGLVMTVVGLALAVWTTTSAATTLMQGLTKAYDAKDDRGFVRKRATALLIVIALVVCAVLVFGLLILGPHLQRWLGSALDARTVTAWTWWTAEWPLLVAVLSFGFAVVLYLGPDVKHRSWRHTLPGAVVAMIAWLAVSGAFAYYAANFGSYDKSWGTLAAVVITLVWLWLTSAALLFGAEVNSEARRLAAREPQSITLGSRGSPVPRTSSPGQSSG